MKMSKKQRFSIYREMYRLLTDPTIKIEEYVSTDVNKVGFCYLIRCIIARRKYKSYYNIYDFPELMIYKPSICYSINGEFWFAPIWKNTEGLKVRVEILEKILDIKTNN